jgi:uncharacterized heparinase superfamily protein
VSTPARKTRALYYARTLPTLQTSQVLGRLLRVLPRPAPDTGPAPAFVPPRGVAPGARRPPILLAPARLALLNREECLWNAESWNDPARELLVTYHLHYFDCLNARGADASPSWHADLIARWVAENPPGIGRGWDPYPVSRRIASWIRWACAGHALSPAAIHSLAVQARWLAAGLETHLRGNHLLANAKALVCAGLAFEGGEADGWLALGLELFARELAEQILPDGGHFERSPMYHALVLEDLLELYALGRASAARLGDRAGHRELWVATAQRMRAWLAAMLHPDGELSFFNDTTLGVAPPAAELDLFARRLGLDGTSAPRPGITRLAESGYLRLARGDAVLIADVGEVGPRYQPGHGHADTLSFELSLGTERVIVNSGVSLYERGSERLRQRSTAAHSTVLVDGEDSSEVWDSFRVARRARPLGLELVEREGEVLASAAHDGYRRLSGRPLHRREWRLSDERLVVRDRIEGGFRRAEARSFLHPGVTAHLGGPEGGVLALASGRALAVTVEGGTLASASATWHPGFHRSVPSRCLQGVFQGPELSFALFF